jgi:hypothetical protein
LLAPLANERINAMNDTTIGLETEQEILTHEISDEALETAGTEIAGNFTMFCSGIQCPGGPVLTGFWRLKFVPD